MSVVFSSGGFVFWILVLLLVSAAFVYFERLLELRRAQVDYQDFIKGVVNVLESGNIEEALAICDDSMTPVGNIASSAIRHMNSGSDSVKDVAGAQARVEAGRLERRLGTLAVIGEISPLIGLFGTIVGFVQAVLSMDSQTVISRADLIGGAMPAFVSAGTGIFLAIVVSVMHASLRYRLDRIVLELDAATVQIVDFVSSFKNKNNAA